MRHSELDQYELDPACARLLDEDFCRAHLVAPLGPLPSGGDAIPLGMTDPGNVALVADVTARLGRAVIPVQLNAWEVRRALDILHALGSADVDEEVKLKLEAGRRISFEPDQTPPRLLDDLLSEAVRAGASDVHIEVYPHDVDLRFRIDGILRQVNTPLSVATVGRVISRLKVLAQLDLTEHRKPQDGRIILTFRDRGSERRLQLRVASIPGLYGDEVVLRILDPAAVIVDLDRLGMSAATLARYEAMIRRPNGMILVAGPTCSGKTTTLYATLHRINTP